MGSLPDELWTDILDYLNPDDIVSTQRVSSHLLKVARDSRLWRFKCFEKAPSAAQFRASRSNALSTLTGALGGLSLDGPVPPPSQQTGPNTAQTTQVSKRAKAVAEWDCSDPAENIDWYSEYIARHAPLSVEWDHRANHGLDVRGMALHQQANKVIGPLDDGSLCIWNITRAGNGRPRVQEVNKSHAGILFQDLTASAGPSAKKEPSLGHAIDNITLDSRTNRAYVAAESYLNEVDIEQMKVISQHKYAWPITALSHEDDSVDFRLTIGTSWSLHVHDSRLPLKCPSSPVDQAAKIDGTDIDPSIAFLPNFKKLNAMYNAPMLGEERDDFDTPRHRGLHAYARVDPGPQSIVHQKENEIVIAGRMPSILFYDRRCFPKLQSTIHSGARLSSLVTLPWAPVGTDARSSGNHTLIAGGEYRGCGSLEIYELPSQAKTSSSTKLYDLSASGQADSMTFQISDHLNAGPTIERELYSYKNRVTTSSAKLLSVCVQGTRILFSDAEGQLKWVERDGKGLARRWNINATHYNYSLTSNSAFSTSIVGSIGPSGGDVVRKMIPLLSPQATSKDANTGDPGTIGATRGDDDILVWTGEKLGIVTSKSRWDTSLAHDELVEAFEKKMDLNAGMTDEEKEIEYAQQMRRALERQADERRWMSRFGGRWR